MKKNLDRLFLACFSDFLRSDLINVCLALENLEASAVLSSTLYRGFPEDAEECAEIFFSF